MALRVRKDVVAMPTWDPALEWYAKAVHAMQQRPARDPMSWDFQAAIHGFSATLNAWKHVKAADMPPQSVVLKYWRQCQHGSWFFLPWHRMYLAYFEEIVAQSIVSLGGPVDWALPYWNYSDPANPDSRMLPGAFTDAQAPGLAGNPLNVPSRDLGNAGHTHIPVPDVRLIALQRTVFTSPQNALGFGGPATAFSHSGAHHGALEQLPHDMVHVDIGGIMGDPRTAGLDPIFWLHHANIDRLWEAWLLQGGGRSNPSGSNWQDFDFPFHGASGAPVSVKVSAVLDTKKVLGGYTYESLTPAASPVAATPAPAIAGPALAAHGTMAFAMKPKPAPIPMTDVERDAVSAPAELVGWTKGGHQLGSTAQSMSMSVSEPQSPHLSAASKFFALTAKPAAAFEQYLNFENVTGEGVAPVYDVYIGLPTGADPLDHPDQFAGSLSMFGVAEASESSSHESGSGKHYVLQVTDILQNLRQRPDWDEKDLRVTLVPRRPMPDDCSIKIGRISLYTKAEPTEME